MKRVLILGAGGFVGSRLVDAVACTDWATPIAAMRPAAGRRSLGSGVEARVCDATDALSLEEALRGVDCVVNCVFGSGQAMVGAAKLLFSAALKLRLERVIHLSSMAVYGAATGTVGEAAPLVEDIGWYGQAKVAAERIAVDFARQGGAVVILRPSCVYGPGSPLWTVRIARWLRAGRVGDLGPNGDGLCNLIYIDDLASAVLESLRRPGLEGQAFNVSNADPEAWNKYFMRLGRAIGATPIRRISARRLRLETTLLAPPLKVLEIGCQRLGFRGALLPHPILPSLARQWRQEIILDTRKSDAQLGFCRTSLDHGIAASARWLGSSRGDRMVAGRSASFLK
jgi:nucleoside-diphosphate-sugar epimerase